jgi:sugar phosphate isomerase/epimerase
MYTAIRDAMLKEASGQSIFETLKTTGSSAIEINVLSDGSYNNLVLEDGSTPYSNSNTSELKERLDKEGVRVAALLMGTDFSGEDADEHVEWAKRTIQAAHELGAPAVRIDTATRNQDISVDEVRDNFVRRISKVLQDTASTGIGLGIENHGRISNDPKFLDEVFAAVGDDRLGMTLDIANFYWWGHPLDELYPILERFAPYARHTHMKNIDYPQDMMNQRREIGFEYGRYAAPIYEGNIDIKRVIGILKTAGYTHSLCIENEALKKAAEGEERIDVLRREVQHLNESLQA